jgi:hypothetical protein
LIFFFLQHISWLLGGGRNINFWLDNWCGQPLVHVLNIPSWAHPRLNAKVDNFLVNHVWSIPQNMQLVFHNLSTKIKKVTISLGEVEDKMDWSPNDVGELSLSLSLS